MLKQEFSNQLKKSLIARGIAETEIRKFIDYYSEMIDDRIEDGMTEESAIEALGDIEEITKQILLEIPLGVLVKSKIKTQKEKHADRTGLTVLLLILGFPLWLPLLTAGFSLIIAVYAVIFSLIVAVFALVITLGASGFISIPAAGLLVSETAAGAVGMLGIGFLLIGIALLLIFPAKYAVIGLLKLTKLILRSIKSLFIGTRRAC